MPGAVKPQQPVPVTDIPGRFKRNAYIIKLDAVFIMREKHRHISRVKSFSTYSNVGKPQIAPGLAGHFILIKKCNAFGCSDKYFPVLYEYAVDNIRRQPIVGGIF